MKSARFANFLHTAQGSAPACNADANVHGGARYDPDWKIMIVVEGGAEQTHS
jgi:hypothetical protein